MSHILLSQTAKNTSPLAIHRSDVNVGRTPAWESQQDAQDAASIESGVPFVCSLCCFTRLPTLISYFSLQLPSLHFIKGRHRNGADTTSAALHLPCIGNMLVWVKIRRYLSSYGHRANDTSAAVKRMVSRNDATFKISHRVLQPCDKTQGERQEEFPIPASCVCVSHLGEREPWLP